MMALKQRTNEIFYFFKKAFDGKNVYFCAYIVGWLEYSLIAYYENDILTLKYVYLGNR